MNEEAVKKNAKWLEKLAFSMAIKSMEIVFEYFANAQNAIACFSIKNSKKNGRFCLVKPNVCTFMSLMIKYSNRLRWIHIFHDKTRTRTHSKWICLQFHRICRFLKLYDKSCIFYVRKEECLNFLVFVDSTVSNRTEPNRFSNNCQ